MTGDISDSSLYHNYETRPLVAPARFGWLDIYLFINSACPRWPLTATIGLVEPGKLLRYLPVIRAAGLQAAPLHLEAYRVPPALIQALLGASD